MKAAASVPLLKTWSKEDPPKGQELLEQEPLRPHLAPPPFTLALRGLLCQVPSPRLVLAMAGLLAALAFSLRPWSTMSPGLLRPTRRTRPTTRLASPTACPSSSPMALSLSGPHALAFLLKLWSSMVSLALPREDTAESHCPTGDIGGSTLVPCYGSTNKRPLPKICAYAKPRKRRCTLRHRLMRVNGTARCKPPALGSLGFRPPPLGDSPVCAASLCPSHLTGQHPAAPVGGSPVFDATLCTS